MAAREHPVGFDPATQARFERAVDKLVARLRDDPSVLAVVLFGSLAYDVVWEKSDVDLMVIAAEPRAEAERKLIDRGVSLVENDVDIHVQVMPRSRFKRMIEGSLRSSFMHSAFARSTLLFTRDPTLDALYEQVHRLGGRDRQVQLLRTASGLMPLLAKAEKFLYVKNDPGYAALWIGYLMPGLAQIEVYLHGEVAGREVVHQALEHNPAFFGRAYTAFFDGPKTRETVATNLEAIDGYLLDRQEQLFAPLYDYLAEQGEVRSATEIETHFDQQMGIGGVIMGCEWLATKGLITKASSPLRITRRSPSPVDEQAFFYERDLWGV